MALCLRKSSKIWFRNNLPTIIMRVLTMGIYLMVIKLLILGHLQGENIHSTYSWAYESGGGGGQLPSQIRAKQWGKFGQSKKNVSNFGQIKPPAPLNQRVPIRPCTYLFSPIRMTMEQRKTVIRKPFSSTYEITGIQ